MPLAIYRGAIYYLMSSRAKGRGNVIINRCNAVPNAIEWILSDWGWTGISFALGHLLCKKCPLGVSQFSSIRLNLKIQISLKITRFRKYSQTFPFNSVTTFFPNILIPEILVFSFLFLKQDEFITRQRFSRFSRYKKTGYKKSSFKYEIAVRKRDIQV